MKTFKLTIMALLAFSAVSCTQKMSSGIDTSNLDTTVVPQNDFYQYACGGWMQANPLTAEYSRFGSFDKLAEDNRTRINDLIAEIASQDNRQGTIEQKIGDLYNLAMDTARRNAEGLAPVKPLFDDIESITAENLSYKLGESLLYGMFGLYPDADEMNSSMNILKIYQGGFELGEKTYYFDQDERTQNIRDEYVKHVARMFELYGFSNAEQKAATVMRLETRLAAAAKNSVELRDPYDNYNKMTVDELKALVPQIVWDDVFRALDIEVTELSVGQVDFLKEVGLMIEQEPLDDLKTLFQWQTISETASSLNDELYMASFDFWGRVMSGKEEPSPLWKRAVSIVNGTVGEAVGQIYVAKYFPPEAKKRMLKLVHNLQTSLSERIEAQEWMSDETKAKAQEKLSAFYVKIGYPDKFRDYTDLDINAEDSYLTNLLRARKFENAYEMSFVGKPVDRERWYMTPQTVNAYYNPATNEICFPAGILQPPFFDMQADDAFNYGAIGVVIGHEMTHGFDDQGSHFDKDGNLNEWWTEEDRANFVKRTQVMVDYFDKIEVLPGLFANGSLTLGENIADHGGLNVSFQAYKNATAGHQLPAIDGFTADQRFFLAYANLWANNIRDEQIALQTKSDPHSLGRWRVNGALPHINAWYEAWNVTEESPMYVAPADRVTIW